jgi:proteic killer suppression protein
MIRSFADSQTKQIYDGFVVKKISIDVQKQTLRKLQYIDAARKIEDLRIPPSNKLELKQGNLKGFYAIWVNKQWRIIFRWVDNDAYDVQLIDYH